MKALKTKPAICSALFVAAACVSIGAHAEYRCKAPATPEDKQACELAKLSQPDELRHFIQRTNGAYGLYFFDYVMASDFTVSNVARHNEAPQSIAMAGPSVVKEPKR